MLNHVLQDCVLDRTFATARRGRVEGVVKTVSLRAGVLAAGLALAGCGPSGFGGPRGDLPTPPPTAQTQTPPAAVVGEAFGTGPVRVALIAPMTQGSGPSVVGQSLRNAAELAVAETGADQITLLVKDDQSTPEGARAAAQAALGDGAELIIGPLFASGVKEAGRLARAANKPVIAFSTDASAAARGVYLLSFMVEGYVDRIIDYAAARGKKSIAALIPENDYGNVAATEFQTAAARAGLRVMAVERYRPATLKEAVGRVAAVAGQIDSLFIPEQAEAMGAVAQALTAANLDSKHVQILGTGLWNDARVVKLPALQGAWFAAPENGGFNAFAQRYRAKFNADPTRIATLAYDATTLAIALARSQGPSRYSEGVLTNPSGFNGADGVFRLRADGVNERGLSVLQIGNFTTTIVSPAPRSFTGAPS